MNDKRKKIVRFVVDAKMYLQETERAYPNGIDKRTNCDLLVTIAGLKGALLMHERMTKMHREESTP